MTTPLVAIGLAARRAAAIAALGVAVSTPALAASFLSAQYDQERDELVVTLTYRGTNADHAFSIDWGACKAVGPAGSYRLAARVIDSQWNDPAREPFTKTARFSLQSLRCRPATVTLFTAPQFTISVVIPARGDANRMLRGPLTDAH